MNNKIEIFAALKSFYDSDNDLLKIYENLILKNLESDQWYSIDRVHELLKKNAQVDVPNDAIHTIIKKAKRDGFINCENLKTNSLKSICITKEGQKQRDQIIECFAKVEREKNGLLQSIKIFIQKTREKSYSVEEIENDLNFFIEQNMTMAIATLDGEKKNIEAPNSELQAAIAEYFKFTEKNDQNNFEILKSILFGKIISSSFLLNNFDKNANFSGLNIFLDTNIVFSIMGFHEDFFNDPVNELIKILKKLKISLKIFSFTKEEIIFKLRGYLNSYSDYYSEIKVDSIYSVLKRKKYSKIAVIGIIENIEKVLKEKDIEIDYNYKAEDLLKDKDDYLQSLSKIKTLSSQFSIEHDLSAILAIRKMRGRISSHLFEKSRYAFLSADWLLASYDYSAFGHYNDHTFPEVIFRNELVSILWLKNQEGCDNILIQNFFSNFARKELISRPLWERFIKELKAQKDKGAITDEDIQTLISYEEVEKILRERGENGIKEILDEEKINIKKKESLELATKSVHDSKVIQIQEKEIIERGKKVIENEKIIEAQNDKFDKVIRAVENDCRNKCHIFINCLLWVLMGIVLYLMFFIFLYINNWFHLWV